MWVQNREKKKNLRTTEEGELGELILCRARAWEHFSVVCARPRSDWGRGGENRDRTTRNKRGSHVEKNGARRRYPVPSKKLVGRKGNEGIRGSTGQGKRLKSTNRSILRRKSLQPRRPQRTEKTEEPSSGHKQNTSRRLTRGVIHPVVAQTQGDGSVKVTVPCK